jgi:hypothetical protein
MFVKHNAICIFVIDTTTTAPVLKRLGIARNAHSLKLSLLVKSKTIFIIDISNYSISRLCTYWAKSESKNAIGQKIGPKNSNCVRRGDLSLNVGLPRALKNTKGGVTMGVAGQSLSLGFNFQKVACAPAEARAVRGSGRRRS